MRLGAKAKGAKAKGAEASGRANAEALAEDRAELPGSVALDGAGR